MRPAFHELCANDTVEAPTRRRLWIHDSMRVERFTQVAVALELEVPKAASKYTWDATLRFEESVSKRRVEFVDDGDCCGKPFVDTCDVELSTHSFRIEVSGKRTEERRKSTYTGAQGHAATRGRLARAREEAALVNESRARLVSGL